jgi:hypothetical protein
VKKGKNTNKVLLVSTIKDEDKEQLIRIIIQQAELIERQQEENEELNRRLKELEEKIEELERRNHRQAAPFRREESKKVSFRRSPGRKKGHQGSYRQPPQEVDETVEVPLENCPKCGGALATVTPVKQIIEEIPPTNPRRYRLVTFQGICSQCGEVHSTHPLKTSGATGAAQVQLGPRAKALALQLNYGYGLSKRKTARIMEEICGLSATASGWHYASTRISKKCEQDYRRLLEQARKSDYLHSDETSWYMGTPKSWLWVFTNRGQTLYKVSESRGREVLREVIGENYQGTLVSDCLAVYDDVNHSQQKCYSHHLKEINKARENNPGEKQAFFEEIKNMLKTAMHIKKVKGQVSRQRYRKACEKLEKQADRLLIPSRADPAEEKIANRLRKQRDHLFTFLYQDEVEATNNLAERQLRPAVIARKISCGNKTRKGADTWQTLTSLIVTNNQIGQDNTSFFRQKAIFSA